MAQSRRWGLLLATAPTDPARSEYTRRDGVLVPRQASVTFRRDPVVAQITATREGRYAPVVRSLTAWSATGSLTTSDLRGIPTGDLASRAIAACVLRTSPPPSRPDADPVLVDGRTSWWWWPTDDVERARRLDRGGRPRKPRDHELVAATYRANPDRPTQAVAEALGVGRRQAVRYVEEAREAGYDLPAPRRPRGESS